MASYSAILPSVVGEGRQSADSVTRDVSLRPPDGLRPGRDVPLMTLDAGGRFRLACDSLQWITQRRRGKTWRGDSFVTTRKVLLRDLRELGCELTPKARAAIERLPETFEEWLEQRAAQGGSLRGVRAPAQHGGEEVSEIGGFQSSGG